MTPSFPPTPPAPRLDQSGTRKIPPVICLTAPQLSAHPGPSNVDTNGLPSTLSCAREPLCALTRSATCCTDQFPAAMSNEMNRTKPPVCSAAAYALFSCGTVQ